MHRWQAMYSTARASPVDYGSWSYIYIYMLYICIHIYILSYMYVYTHYCFVAFLVLYLSVSIYIYTYIYIYIIDPAFLMQAPMPGALLEVTCLVQKDLLLSFREFEGKCWRPQKWIGTVECMSQAV